MIKQFFYGALGATVFSSFFLSNDIEINELESLNEEPDLTKLRYPTNEDISLYIQRIISSGFLAIIGAFVLMGGFGYLEVTFEVITLKQKILFALVSFLIGLFQGNFYAKLESVFKRIFNSDK